MTHEVSVCAKHASDSNKSTQDVMWLTSSKGLGVHASKLTLERYTENVFKVINKTCGISIRHS